MRVPALLLVLVLGGCATPKATSFATAERDPWEQSNRRIYGWNRKVDKVTLRPAAQAYRTAVPEIGRKAITSFFSNYGEPANFVNAVLQGKIKQALRTVDRFVVNSTLGVGGVNDVATDLGRPQEPEDFGQTFATWGIGSGPYIMLPFFGPATLREAVAFPLDFIIDPSDFTRNALLSPNWFVRGGQIAFRLTNTRARLIDAGGDQMLAGSLDEYTLVKSAYLQRRKSLLFDGSPPIEDDPFADPMDAPLDAPKADLQTPLPGAPN